MRATPGRHASARRGARAPAGAGRGLARAWVPRAGKAHRSDLPFGEPRRSLVICFTGSILPRSLEHSRFVSLLVAAPSAAAAFAPVVPGSGAAVGSALVSRQRLTGSRPPAWEAVHARPDGPALDHSGEPASLVVNASTVRRLGSGGFLCVQEKPHECTSAEHGRCPQRTGLLGRAAL